MVGGGQLGYSRVNRYSCDSVWVSPQRLARSHCQFRASDSCPHLLTLQCTASCTRITTLFEKHPARAFPLILSFQYARCSTTPVYNPGPLPSFHTLRSNGKSATFRTKSSRDEVSKASSALSCLHPLLQVDVRKCRHTFKLE